METICITLPTFGSAVTVNLDRKKMKTCRLKVYPNQKIVLSLPQSAPDAWAESFLMEKSDWIESKLQSFQKTVGYAATKEIRNGYSIRMLGEDMIFALSQCEKECVYAEGKKIRICCKSPEEQAHVKQLFEAWWRRQAKEILQDFDKAVSLDRRDYDRYINIYKALSQAGEEEKGKTYLEQSASLLSDKQAYEKGRILYYMEDYNGAVSILEGLSEAGDNGATLYLGKSYEALGDMNYAASLYEKYLQTDESNGEVYNQLGLCKLNMGEYETALSCFQKGIATGEVEVMQELLFNEASAYEYISDFSTAKTKFSEYLAKYPNDENAKREYEFLKTR